MIIATKQLDYNALKSYANNLDGIVNYVDKTVPDWARHLKFIVMNQRFYTAVHLRKTLTLPYKARMTLSDKLLEDVRVTGVVSKVITLKDVLSCCDKHDLGEMIRCKLGRESNS